MVVLLVVVLLVVVSLSSSLELSSHFSTISLHLYAHLTTKEYELFMYYPVLPEKPLRIANL